VKREKMNAKSNLKAISIGIAAIMMVSLFAVMSVSASVVTDCWIGTSDDKVYFTIENTQANEETGYASLYVNGAYEERKKFSLNSGDTKTLSFREYKWSGCEDVEVCVDNSCASPSVVVKSCWISAHYEVYFTVYSDAKAEGHALLYVNGKYTERRKYTLNAGETRTLSFDTYRWSHQCKDMEVCVDNSCCKCPCIWPLVPPTPSAPPSPRPDLVITDIRENDGTICFKIENWGTEEAESSYTSLYLNGAYQARRKVGSLAAGESTELCFGYVYTPDTDDIVKVCADSGNDVAESNEGNNCKVWTCIPPRGEYWAVIAGVSDYADPSIPDLSYCDDDANDIYSRLLSYDNWKASNMRLLIDSAATKANIHNAIDWMKTNADDNDICLFFFSGHGSWSDDVPPLDEYDGYDEYICPYDSTYWFDDNIRDDELDEWMTPITAKKIVILDSCLAGGAYRGTDTSTKAKPNVPYPKLAKDFAKDLAKDLNKAGYVVLAACDDWDSAWEYDILENGVFTYYVVEGLDGPANADADNDISTEEIYEYADPLVIDYTDGWQDPVLYDNVPGELPVVKIGIAG
jgi:hypothetical protein